MLDEKHAVLPAPSLSRYHAPAMPQPFAAAPCFRRDIAPMPHPDAHTILVIDDQPSNLSAICGLLENRGYRVAVAQDGEEGLLRARLLLPELILLDVMLPDSDGFEICRRLKADETTREIPVLFTTALDSLEYKLKGFEAGGADYLTKPLQNAEVLARVGVQLDLHATKRRLAERKREFRSLAENSPDYIIRYDLAGRILYLNMGLVRHMGIAAAAEVIGKRPCEAWPDGRYAMIDRAIAQAMETEAETNIEIEAPTPSGEWGFFQIRVVPEWDEAGTMVGTIAFGRDITAFKRYQNELIAREIEFRSLAENLPDNIARWDAEGRYVYANQILARTIGVPVAALVGKPIRELFPDEEFAQIATAVEQVIATGQPQTFVRQYLLGEDGDTRIHEIRLIPEFGADGQIVSVLGIGRDITEQIRAERDLLILGSAIDNASDGAMLIDGRQRFVYANAAACRSLGYSRDDLLQLGPADINPDMSRETLARMLANLFAHGPQLGRIESRHRAADGRIFPVEMSASVVEHEDEKLALVMVRDISERKRLENELRARELEFRSLAENAPDNIARYDRQGRHLYVNPQLEQTIGLDPRDILGKTPEDIYPGSQLPVILAVAETGEAREVELVLPDAGAGVRHHHVRFVAERGVDGDIVGVLGIGRDITERKRAETERQAHLRFLEALDRVNLSIQGADDFDRMMSDVLDEILAIFDCDRASLMYPCDPAAAVWRVPMERTRPEYPGVLPLNLDVPMDEEGAANLRLLLEQDGPLKFGPGNEYALPAAVSKRVGFKSIMSMAVYPRADKPWQFGIHQCSHARVWTAEEEKLFREIGRRLTDGLSSLLAHRRVQENETYLRTLVRTIPDLVWAKDVDGVFLRCNAQFERLVGVPEAEIVGKTDFDIRDSDLAGFYRENDRQILATGKPRTTEEWLSFAADGYRGLFEVVRTPLWDESGRLLGVLGIARDITRRRETEKALRDLAARREAAREEERRRIARELHDDLGQQISALRFGVTMIEYQFGADMPPLREATARLLDQVGRIVQTTRAVSSALRPAVLDMGIVPALEWLVGEYASHGDVAFELRAAQEDDVRMDETLAVVVFRIAQEALTNAIRHSRADRIRVAFAREGGCDIVEIGDNGVGFDPDSPCDRHSTGLVGMRERALAVGGELFVTSAPGRGTTIQARIPLTHEGKEREA